jgi:hypothetical protein
MVLVTFVAAGSFGCDRSSPSEVSAPMRNVDLPAEPPSEQSDATADLELPLRVVPCGPSEGVAGQGSGGNPQVAEDDVRIAIDAVRSRLAAHGLRETVRRRGEMIVVELSDPDRTGESQESRADSLVELLRPGAHSGPCLERVPGLD